MYKVTLKTRGLFVRVEVLDTKTNETKRSGGEAFLGDAEQLGRSLAETIINQMKAREEEMKVITYEVE